MRLDPERLVVAMPSVAVFAWLAIGSSSAHFWLDSGEIAAAGAELGVMHPPGVVGFVPLLHAVLLFPIGSLGHRMALLSAALGACAVAALLVLLRRRGAHWAICVGAAILVALSLTFVRNARVVEIYTLAGALVLVALWGLDPDRRDLGPGPPLVGVMAGVVGSLGFGDLRLVLGPMVVVLWVLALRRGEAWARWAPLVVVLALSIIATLPLSSARGPITDWGDPDGLGRLWRHLSAASIREAHAARILPRAVGPWIHESALFGERLGQDLGPLGPAAAAGAILFGLQRRRTKLFVLVAILVVGQVFYCVAINPMGGADRQTGLVVGLLAILALGLGAHELALERPKVALAVLPIAFIAMAVPAAFWSVPDLANTRSWGPHAWTRNALAEPEPGSLLLVQQDDLAAGALYARVVEGARPDLVVLVGQHLSHPRPDDVALDDRAAALFDGVSAVGTEAARIRAALEAFPGPEAIESPGVAVMESVRWLDPGGSPPVARVRHEGELAFDVDRLAEQWSTRLETPLDRERLAAAIGQRVTADLILRSHSHEALVEGRNTLATVLRDVAPDDPRTLISLGALEDRLGHTDRAIMLTRRAVALDPERTQAHLNLALYLSRDEDLLDEAERVAARLAFRRPDLADAWVRLADICRARSDQDCVARAGRGLDRARR